MKCTQKLPCTYWVTKDYSSDKENTSIRFTQALTVHTDHGVHLYNEVVGRVLALGIAENEIIRVVADLAKCLCTLP
jgi:hypothetical protein